MHTDQIAVLIPCYNEAKTIKKVIEDWRKELPEAILYVYDNNSTDDTAKIAQEAGAIVRHEKQQGKGNVVRRMFQDIDALCYVIVDGDDTYPAEYGREMVDEVLNNRVDMFIGDRLSPTYFQENKRPFHNFGNSLVRWCINNIFVADVKDIMTGYRAFSYRFVKTFPVLSKGFEIETEMTIHAVDKNMSIKNTVISYRDRPEGSESKLNTFQDGIKVLCTIFRMLRNHRPLRFYGFLSLVLVLIAAVLFIPVFYEYLLTGLVPRFPTLIVSEFLSIAALISLFSGLMLHMNAQKDRRDFEFYIYIAENMKKHLFDKS